MKSKIAVVLLTGLFTSTLALAQTSSAPGGAAAAPPPSTPSTSPPAAAPAAAPAGDAAAPAAAPAATPGAATTESPAAAAPGAVSPIIQFQDVTLTSAIENLARMANLNYIIDPKVPYGQPGPDGKVLSQPNISIRWENLSAEQALTALLNNYSLQLIDDPKTHISRISVKDPAAPDPLVTRIIQLKYAGASNFVGAVQSVLTDKRSKVVADVRTSQLVVVATEKEQTGVDELVNKLDLPTRQVLIEARLMEISHSPTTAKGIDWSGTLKGQNISFGNGQVQAAQTAFQAPGTATTLPSGRPGPNNAFNSTTTTGSQGGQSGSSSGSSGSSAQSGGTSLSGGLIPNGLSWNTLAGFSPDIGFMNADGVHAVLDFLNANSDAQVISTPRAVTLDNETATLAVTRAEPIFRNTAGTQGSPGGSEVQYTNLGTILHVTPRISANDYIWLKVIPEVSSVGGTVTKTVASTVNQADEYDIRKIETQVLIPSGNTLVMGGLMSDATVNNNSKVPILGDIPVVGLAFRHESKSRLKRNLLVFVTPTIIKDTDFQASQSAGPFLKSRPTEMSGTIDTTKPWESALPYDWSNPKATPYDEAVFDDSLLEKKKKPSAP